MKTIPSFSVCNSETLKKLEIGEGVTTIEKKAFTGLEALKEVVLPSSLSQVGELAFHSKRRTKRLKVLGSATDQIKTMVLDLVEGYISNVEKRAEEEANRKKEEEKKKREEEKKNEAARRKEILE